MKLSNTGGKVFYNKMREGHSFSTLCIGRDGEMSSYDSLPADFLIAFYNDMLNKIEKGILTKNMYYELGLMISVAHQRGITLDRPCDFEQFVDQKDLDEYIHFTYKQHTVHDESLTAPML